MVSYPENFIDPISPIWFITISLTAGIQKGKKGIISHWTNGVMM